MTTVLMYTLGVVLFVVGVAASIGLRARPHGAGEEFGVKVTQYFIGFGRTVWSRRRGETEYGVKAIPLGGYVKLVGMLPPGPEDDPEPDPQSNTGMFTQLISDARAAASTSSSSPATRSGCSPPALVEEGHRDGRGPTLNLVLAFLLFGGVFMLHGQPGRPPRSTRSATASSR